MALAKAKQIEILDKAKEIENKLSLKYKRMVSSLTFGGKVKYFQEKNKKNIFLINALWNIVQTRNYIAHENDFKISLKEYNFFLDNYKYVNNPALLKAMNLCFSVRARLLSRINSTKIPKRTSPSRRHQLNVGNILYKFFEFVKPFIPALKGEVLRLF